MGPQPAKEFSELKILVDQLFERELVVERLDILTRAELLDLGDEIMELLALLPPMRYTKLTLCEQLMSSLGGHGWEMRYKNPF